jgi:undecaprenyl pyrophosphate phosphatase UppP
VSILLFVAGLVIALGLGHFAVKWFLDSVRAESDVPADRPGAGVPNWIIGLFERTFAFLIILAAVEGAYAVLGAWIAAKLALNWQRHPYKDDPEEERLVRVYGISALMAGILSLGFGVVGGVISRSGLVIQ